MLFQLRRAYAFFELLNPPTSVSQGTRARVFSCWARLFFGVSRLQFFLLGLVGVVVKRADYLVWTRVQQQGCSRRRVSGWFCWFPSLVTAIGSTRRSPSLVSDKEGSIGSSNGVYSPVQHATQLWNDGFLSLFVSIFGKITVGWLVLMVVSSLDIHSWDLRWIFVG